MSDVGPFESRDTPHARSVELIERDGGPAIRLPDGRVLGFRESGDASGMPLIWLPGTPGSRRWRAPDEDATRRAGVRLIVTERPGFGVSDFVPGRQIADTPIDIASVADALGIDRFVIAGTSGAGPYIAACALLLPRRVRAAFFFGCAAPLDVAESREGMSMRRRIMYRLLPWAPRLVPLLERRDAEQIYQAMVRDAPPCDRLVLDRVWDAQLAMAREALRPGMRGFAYELALAAGPWGFSLANIHVPCFVWHGALDASTPLAMGRALARHIPGAQLRVVEGAGHFLHFDLWSEVLAAVRDASRD